MKVNLKVSLKVILQKEEEDYHLLSEEEGYLLLAEEEGLLLLESEEYLLLLRGRRRSSYPSGRRRRRTSSSGEEEEESVIEESEREILSEEDRILEDYDRIYPPKDNNRISLSRYKEMEQFVSDTDEERQRRLTCPLHEMRYNNCQVENEFGTHGSLNRGEGWIGGNVHVRQNRQEPKVFTPSQATSNK